MASPYIIRISSQKGGVGKTTVAVNLAAMLSMLDFKVLIADCDAANPSVGIHLGMEQANVGYKDVVYGKAQLSSAIAVHAPSGLKVLPGTIGAYSFTPEPARFESFVKLLSETRNDFVIIDTAPGFTIKEPLRYYGEALLITTPEMASCTSIMRLARLYTANKLKHHLVINRIKNKRYEFSVDEIEDMYENKALATIPEDESVPMSVSQHIPAIMGYPKSNFSESIREMARRYSNMLGRADMDYSPRSSAQSRRGILAFLKRLLGL